MKILGLQKLTLLDYPEHLGAVVFLGGCNFRCPFCQNGDLVQHADQLPVISREELFSFLKKRAGILEGVVVSGGEPTLYRELPDFLAEIRELGYLIKLDTNGTNPDMLQELIDHRLIDYTAMDIKAGRFNYRRVCGLSSADPALPHSDASPEFDALLAKIQRSITILKNSSISYEFRTTVVQGLHTAADFEDIAKWIAPLPASVPYYLQSYRDCPEILCPDPAFRAFSETDMRTFLSLIQTKIPNAKLRGMD